MAPHKQVCFVYVQMLCLPPNGGANVKAYEIVDCDVVDANFTLQIVWIAITHVLNEI